MLFRNTMYNILTIVIISCEIMVTITLLVYKLYPTFSPNCHIFPQNVIFSHKMSYFSTKCHIFPKNVIFPPKMSYFFLTTVLLFFHACWEPWKPCCRSVRILWDSTCFMMCLQIMCSKACMFCKWGTQACSFPPCVYSPFCSDWEQIQGIMSVQSCQKYLKG